MRRALALASLCAAAVGCLDDNPSLVGPPQNQCTTDRDCATGRCDAAQHRCLASARSEVFFSIAPTSGRGSASGVTTLTQPMTIRSGETVDVALRAPRTVYGVVTVPADPANRDPTRPDQTLAPTLIAATVEFTPTGLPGVSTPVQAVAGATAMTALQGDRATHTWSATLTEGLFDVVVRPASALVATVPPRFERSFEVRADGSLQRFDIAYPATYSRWSGVVRDRAGHPLPGLTVRAVDLSRDAMVVSTVVTTRGDGNTAGSFAIDLGPGAPDAWTLRITSETSSRGWLSMDVPRATLAAMDPSGHDLQVVLPSDTGLPYIDGMRPTGMPAMEGPLAACVGCVDVRATVEGETPSGATRPLAGASVVLRTTLTAPPSMGDARLWFECRAVTDNEGALQAWMIPGSYDVVVTPQDGAFANTVRHGFVVRSDATQQAGQVFSAAQRAPFDGRVLTPRGNAMRGAQVTAIPFQGAYVDHPCLHEPDHDVLAPRARSAQTTTLADGSYRLDLDPGLYRVLVEPLASSGFPSTLSAPVCVTGSVTGFDVTLDAPLEVSGTVRDAARATVPRASVEAIVRVREAGAPGVVVRVARASAGDDGRYTLRLPSSVGQTGE